MKKYLVPALLLLASATSFAQSRDLGAYRIILDNGGSPLYRLTLRADPAMVGDAVFTFPAGGGSFPGNGTLDGQTLRWNNTSSIWEPSSLLTNTGTRLGFNVLSPLGKFHFRDTQLVPFVTNYTQAYTDGTGSNGAGYYNGYFDLIANGTNSYGSSSVIGLSGRITASRTIGNILPSAIATLGSIDHEGSGTITAARAVVGQINNTSFGAGPMTTATALHAIMFNNNTIGDLNGVWVQNPIGSGTMSTYNAIKVEQMASAVTSNAFNYTHSTDPVTINSDGKLTVGATPTTMGDRLEIRSSSTATNQVIGAYGQLALAPSGTTTQNSYGLAFDATASDGGDMTGRSLVGVSGGSLSNRTTGGIGRMIGTFGFASNGSTASTADLTGVYGEAIELGASTITEAHAVMGRVFAGAGTISEASSLYASQGSAFGGGSVTNNYGLLIDEMNMGTSSNTAILYDHPSTPFVVTGAGDVGVRTSTPNTSLDVRGSVAIQTGAFVSLAAGGPYYVPGINAMSALDVSADAAGSTLGGLVPAGDGHIMVLYSTGTGNLTISNEDLAITDAYRFRTMTGADIATTGEAAITLMYNSTLSRWIVISVQD